MSVRPLEDATTKRTRTSREFRKLAIARTRLAIAAVLICGITVGIVAGLRQQASKPQIVLCGKDGNRELPATVAREGGWIVLHGSHYDSSQFSTAYTGCDVALVYHAQNKTGFAIVREGAEAVGVTASRIYRVEPDLSDGDAGRGAHLRLELICLLPYVRSPEERGDEWVNCIAMTGEQAAPTTQAAEPYATACKMVNRTRQTIDRLLHTESPEDFVKCRPVRGLFASGWTAEQIATVREQLERADALLEPFSGPS